MNNTPEVLTGQEMDTLVSEVIIYFDRACFTLDSSLHFGVQTDFIFRNDTGFEVARIHFKDKYHYLSRPLYQQKLNHHGPPLTINLKKNLMKSFTSELTQQIFVPSSAPASPLFGLQLAIGTPLKRLFSLPRRRSCMKKCVALAKAMTLPLATCLVRPPGATNQANSVR